MRAFVFVAVAASLCGCASTGAPSPPTVTPTELANLEARATRDSADVEAQLRLAMAYRSQGRPRDALASAQRALALRPANSRAALLVGLTQEDLGDLAQARQLYERLIRSGPPSLRPQLQSRLVLLQRRETQLAVRNALTREAELARTPPRPHTVAVFPLGAPAADTVLGPMGRALTAMLITDLSQTDRLTVLDRTIVQVLLDEIHLAERGYVDEATAARGGRLLGAERLVQGSLASANERLKLDMAIVTIGRPATPPVDTARPAPPPPANRANPRRPAQRRPETPKPPPAAQPPEQKASPLTATRTAALTEADALDQLFDLEKRLALRIYAALGVELTPAERAAVTKRRTENLQALLAYGRGLQDSDAGNYAAALQYFSQATRLDPGFAAARQQLVASRSMLAATRMTTDQLARTTTAVMTATTAAQTTLTGLLRDPLAEVLGIEGTAGKSTIELVIQRPAGAQ